MASGYLDKHNVKNAGKNGRFVRKKGSGSPVAKNTRQRNKDGTLTLGSRQRLGDIAIDRAQRAEVEGTRATAATLGSLAVGGFAVAAGAPAVALGASALGLAYATGQAVRSAKIATSEPAK